MVKFDFEMLVSPTSDEFNSVSAFWTVISRNSFFYCCEDDNVFNYQVNDQLTLEFVVTQQKSDNLLLFKIESQTDVHWRKTYFYDEVRSKLIGLLSSGYEVTLLSRELSRYYAQKCYPIIDEYENNLRQLFYLLFHFKEIGEIDNAIKGKKLKQGKLNIFVEDLNLGELERLFFSKIWLLNENGQYEYFDTSDGLKVVEKISQLHTKPEFKSTWELFILPVTEAVKVDDDLLKRIRQIRNKVSHYKEMIFEDWKFCQEEVRGISKVFYGIQQQMISNEFYSDINNKLIQNSLSLLANVFQNFQKQNSDIIKQLTESTRVVSKILEGVKLPDFSLPVVNMSFITNSMNSLNIGAQIGNNFLKFNSVFRSVNQQPQWSKMLHFNVSTALPSYQVMQSFFSSNNEITGNIRNYESSTLDDTDIHEYNKDKNND